MKRFATVGLFLLSLLLLFDVQAVKPSCGDDKCSGGETSLSCPQDCAASLCGDGVCAADETYISCPADCEAPAVCGDGTCNTDETCSSCEADCGVCPPAPCNYDFVCNAGEDCLGCPTDCAGKTGGKPSQRYCCGLDTWKVDLCGEGIGSPAPVCGDGVQDPGEECDDGNLLDGDGCSQLCMIEVPPSTVPANQFNIDRDAANGVNLSFEWEPPFRYQRIAEALEGDSATTVEQSATLQSDYLCGAARILVPLTSDTPSEDARVRRAVALLSDWDGRLDPDTAAGCLFEIWFRRHLRRELFRDALARESLDGALDHAVAAAMSEDDSTADARIDLELIDRIGAGDAYTAGFLYGYLAGDVDKGVKYGNALASLVQTVPGDFSGFTLEEVEAQLKGQDAKVKR